MLDIIEGVLKALGAARNDTDIVRILDQVATRFGFRSAYLIEYAGRLTAVQRVLDTDPNRRSWWSSYFAGDLRPSPREFAKTLETTGVVVYDSGRFGGGSDRLRAACEANDVVDVTAIPISQNGELVGIAGFCGTPSLTPQQQLGLQLASYSAFAHMRAARLSTPDERAVALTPREREVMQLSAVGLTSVEIAAQLGMSARTVNQHVDNVADKLGTRNRAHTVAEIVRRGLL
ncbi:MAG: helix-turn-helix domain-containing protein [Devosia sp.]|jgi:DNA-binding CsgD family transcriptional regulator